MGDLLLKLLAFLMLGMVVGWRWIHLPSLLAPFLIRWGVPFSLAALLLRAELSPSLLKVGMVGVLVPLLSLGCLFGLSPLRRRLHSPVLILGAVVGNTGYWGLPVALALLSPEALASAVIYDVAGTLITWSVGPLVLLGFESGPARHLNSVLHSPALRGCVLSLLIRCSPWSAFLAKSLWWPAQVVFAMALVLLGMRLGLTIRQRTFAVTTGLPWAVGCKLLVVPLAVWLFGTILRLPPTDQQALVLQGAAPTALSVLLMAETNQETAALASTLVVSSTLLAVVTVPLWWRLFLR